MLVMRCVSSSHVGMARASRAGSPARRSLCRYGYFISPTSLRCCIAMRASTPRRGDFDPFSAFFDVVGRDPLVSQLKLMAEPWDVGRMDSYDIGRFPPLWSEWDGRFRDTARDWWGRHDRLRPERATRLCGP